MSQINRKTFQLSFLAAAVLSLSACSTSPKIAGIDLGEVGSGLGKVGSKTMELGSNAWEGTKNLLHIGPQESELMDEVDLALMEDDANLDNVQLASNDAEPLLPQGDAQTTLSDTMSNQPLLPTSKTTEFGKIPQQPAASGDIVVLGDTNALETETQLTAEEMLAEGTPVAPENSVVPSNDLIHTVTENETLWVIAKSTTGDANNWHVIADINNLAPDASVYVGQKISIPGDMLKPVETETMAIAESATEQPVIKEDQSAAVALTIPQKNTSEPVDAAVVATAEQMKPAASGDASNIMTDATALKVGAGETLWDFAKRTTGDATNWKLIADKNLFGEQQLASIRPGQKIYVPTDIIRSRDENGVLIAKGEEGNIPTATVGGALPQNKGAIDATAAVLAGTNQPAEGEIKIVEAAFQGNKGITPVTAESLSEEAGLAAAETEGELGKVMVSGTYYPKAVYNEADFSSSLLMRVSPGTQLLVSKAVGPWLEVKTDKGIGYVHSRDIK